jgi:hypothetical protein
MTREELGNRSEALRGKLLNIVDQLKSFENDSQYDETYKLAWYPKLIPEHFDIVEKLVDSLEETFNTVLRIP